jgi:shikimate kinase
MSGGTESAPRKSIALVGFMGVGKSKIGRELAARLKLPFIDTDWAIEQTYRLSIADIFRELGEAEFRAAERALITRLLSGRTQVIALGGGVFVDPANRETLNRAATTVWLDVPFEVILPRLLRSKSRPLASNRTEAELRTLWEQRREFYGQAQVRIDASDEEPRHIVERVIAALD